MNSNYVVIMAGGSGTRLWPMSRKLSPKQFHKLASDKSLLEETYERVKDLVPKNNIFVSLVNDILEESQKQLPMVLKENFIVEPVAKNTGPAIALAGLTIFKQNPNALIITIASDHTVEKTHNFQEAIKSAFRFIEKNPDYLVTIGISPQRPEVGFGYIKVGKKFPNSNLFQVEEFVEKPNLATAQKYLKSGKYLWNASYFAFRAATLIRMYEKQAPEIYEQLKKILKDNKKLSTYYKEMPSVPFDTAIAEKIKKIAVIPADLDWSDVGSWSALYDLLFKKTGNDTIIRGNHIGLDDKNCLVYAQDKLLATVGLEDIVVVDTPDVTLICNRNKSQDLKKLIEKIKKEGKEKYL